MGVELLKKQAYVVAFFSPPAQFAGEKDFDQLRQGMLNQIGAKATLRKETPIKLGSHPGREYQLEVEGGMTSVLRLYIVGNRVYMLNATTTVADAAAPEVQRFFNSFRLTQ